MAEKVKREPKPRGPARQFERVKEWQRGAPMLVCRVLPEVYEYARSRPEGPRKFLERLVLTAKAEEARSNESA